MFKTALLLATILVPTCAVAQESNQIADMAVVNAEIWTGDPDNPHATAIAVKDGKFVAVGNEEDIQRWISPDTKIIDAEGKRVLPGLIDTHVHLANAASDMRHLDLRPATSKEHLLTMLSEYAEQFDEDAWVVGTRWSAESWPVQQPPTAEEIDDAVEGRKAMLVRMDGHSIIVSKSALEYCGITIDGPADPPGGSIGRLEDGTPTGAIYEQAKSFISKHVQLPEVDSIALLRKAIAEANRNGITQVGAIESITTIKKLAQLDDEQLLTLKVAATVSGGGDKVSDWESSLQWAVDNPQPGKNVRVLGFKGYMDGTLGSRTAWQTAPYEDNHMALDKSEDNAGYPLAMVVNGELPNLITLGASMGLQPAVHAIGDRSNHVLLDWYESLPKDQRMKLRPRIEHAQHFLPEDVGRFGELNVVASMQPYHKADDGRYAEQRLGSERIRTSYAFRELLDTGARLAFGSDWPVVSVNPFLGIHAAVSAETLDGKNFVPEQSITVEEALACYTRTAAECLLNEEYSGMIKTGYGADFIILDLDIFDIEVAKIPDIEVLLTVVAGSTVYKK